MSSRRGPGFHGKRRGTMIDEIGHFALVLALCIAAVQMSLPLIGAARGDGALIALARPAALGQFLFIAIAFFALMHAYAVSDFSLVNVATNSSVNKPLIYKLTGLWSNHEGSMLLWVFMLGLFGAAVAGFGRNLPPPLRARVLAVQAMIGFGFLLFILLTSNPFLRLLPAPADGNGLNPILQDRGLAFHPPCLYLGYVGFSISFCFAIAALIEGRVDPAWARWVRPWTLAAWIALTIGIAMGSWWAYYTLGWGGWWYWDPVENASFMPWLAGTALLHSAIVVEKREALKSWTILLAIVTFSLSLLGTFLVRSGIIESVHAFASDPTRGVFLLAILATAIGGALILYAIRAPRLEGGGLFAPLSREGALLLNNLFLTTAAMTVLLGTLYPVIADALNLGKITVGPPYFDRVFVPLMVPLVAAAGIGPLLAWKRGDLSAALTRLTAAGVIALTVAVVFAAINGADLHDLAAAGGLGLAAWLASATVTEWCTRNRPFAAGAFARIAHVPRAAHGMSLAHFGFAVVIAGVTASSAWKQEHIQTMAPGQSIDVAGYTLRFDGAVPVQGPNYDAMRGQFVITKEGHAVTTLAPERRTYVQPRQTVAAPAILHTALGDLYTVIGDPQ